MSTTTTHPLEADTQERAFFESTASSNAKAAYRRAVLRTTGWLPSWAERKRAGRKPKAGTKGQQ
ncbi:hypothetical protein [Cupriavidus sp. H39]|uniref:hypothetical protein n=1 Tax=Cupriavidus sp. H39 TaxID=3401635 RepID=UPI003D056E6F